MKKILLLFTLLLSFIFNISIANATENVDELKVRLTELAKNELYESIYEKYKNMSPN